MWTAVEAGRREAERLKIPFGQIVLDTLELPWRAMAGDTTRCAELLDSTRRLQGMLSIPQDDDALGNVMLSLRMWQGRHDEAVALARRYAAGLPPASAITPVVSALLVRAGDHAEAAAYLEAHPVDYREDHWHILLCHCFLAETALGLGRADLARTAYDGLAPHAGRCARRGRRWPLARSTPSPSPWRPLPLTTGRSQPGMPRPRRAVRALGDPARGPMARQRARAPRVPERTRHAARGQIWTLIAASWSCSCRPGSRSSRPGSAAPRTPTTR